MGVKTELLSISFSEKKGKKGGMFLGGALL